MYRSSMDRQQLLQQIEDLQRENQRLTRNLRARATRRRNRVNNVVAINENNRQRIDANRNQRQVNDIRERNENNRQRINENRNQRQQRAQANDFHYSFNAECCIDKTSQISRKFMTASLVEP